jgi:NAD(P)-dependent dehydrogenase (short-subunit alcohol dehydrogenase family)
MTAVGRLAGKVALVTGGSSGIGAAVVHRFVEEGANVVVLANALASDLPQAVVQVQGDVRTIEAYEAALAAATDQFGRLDIFVGNAGVYDNRHAFADYDATSLVAAFDEMFAINVRGYALGALATLPALRRTQGTILFTGSVSSVSAGFGGALYIASKHAVAGLTKQLAYELAPFKVRVNCVAPGYAPTNLRGLSSLDQGMTASAPAAEGLPLGVHASPNDYAEAYVFLASDAGRRMASGSVMVLDGGTVLTGPGPRRPAD